MHKGKIHPYKGVEWSVYGLVSFDQNKSMSQPFKMLILLFPLSSNNRTQIWSQRNETKKKKKRKKGRRDNHICSTGNIVHCGCAACGLAALGGWGMRASFCPPAGLARCLQSLWVGFPSIRCPPFSHTKGV